MKRLRRLSDKRVGGELSDDIILDILHRLPSKSLARFECVSKFWRNCIVNSSLQYSCRSRRWRPQPDLVGFFYQIHQNIQILFFSSKESNNIDDGSRVLDHDSVDFVGRSVYIVASSNGFLLCSKHRKTQRALYYVYNPATRQHLALPKTQIRMERRDDAGVGFICTVDDPDKDIISFTIVRYAIPFHCELLQSTVTIESFSSETNVWTTSKLNLDAPLMLKPFDYNDYSPVACVINGVFCWMGGRNQINVYDCVHKCFWSLEWPAEIDVEEQGRDCVLALSGGALYFVLNCVEITVWRLESDIRSRDAIWVFKYVADVPSAVLQCPEAFGLGGNSLRVEDFGLVGSRSVRVQNIVIHPSIPHIFYFDVRGKVISYDFETGIAQLVYDFGEPWWKTRRFKFFSYEWHQWPRLLY